MIKDISELTASVETMAVRMGSLEQRLDAQAEALEIHDDILRGREGQPGLIADFRLQAESMGRMEKSMESISNTLAEMQRQMYRIHGAWIAIVTMAGLMWSIYQVLMKKP